MLSPVRGHCVCMMCVLAQTEHFHRVSVVVESRLKKKGWRRKETFEWLKQMGMLSFNTSLPAKIFLTATSS